MQLKHIEHFVKTSQYKSFTEAAKNLFLSQPSLSASIAALEQELGYPLFYRSKNGITLTPEGADILPEAKQMLQMQERWLSLARSSAHMQGEIKLSTISLLCSTIVLDFIVLAGQLYPDLKISLYEETPKFVPPARSNHFLSLAMNFYKPEELPTLTASLQKEHWACTVIGDSSSQIFLNAENPLAQQKEILAEQLMEFDLVTYENYLNIPYGDLFAHFPKQKVKKLPSREAIFNFIAKDPSCIGFFSSLQQEHPLVANHTVCCRSIKDYPMPLKLMVLYPQEHQNSPLLQTTIDLLQQTLTHTK